METLNEKAGCFQWFKDTNLKANHNSISLSASVEKVVSNGSKILIWKQITTYKRAVRLQDGCFQWFKDTNLKANHNQIEVFLYGDWVVSNGSKILIWKQITTISMKIPGKFRCFQWFKDTNLKANHNICISCDYINIVVSNGSKILIWKQITTVEPTGISRVKLFPMVQRY